ncbi:hypothetical protein Corgl_0473 [Coriobacterium glomerans PW2]|uniref:HMA domain-containing protein n=1 Tax=Coriobacterium glomerans (strain ATCC 49209 / DSM 20642 / JCM 10262 / PW2) TaxID=700015 RepID=F2N7B6_CORGP|nr:sulfite exporter TauE/SafE family protein [Coriobacterium glomerans]AEB06591.1 hypothetical protein Corgl_0473 [Coriobacterium glomerans PW2]
MDARAAKLDAGSEPRDEGPVSAMLPATALQTVTLRVRGMYCRRCEDVIGGELAAVRGVAAAEARWIRGAVTIRFDPAFVEEAELVRLLADIGYPPGKGLHGVFANVLSVAAIAAVVQALGLIRLPGIPHADQGSSLVYLLAVGLATSAHCVVMCGGLMLSQTSRAGRGSWRRGLGLAATYNAGRVAACTALGALFGAFGAALSFSAIERGGLHALTGAAVACTGLVMWGVLPGIGTSRNRSPAADRSDRSGHALRSRRGIKLGRTSAVSRLLALVRERFGSGPFGPVAVGALNAILPCGASSTMWLVAASSGQPLSGALAMLAWGLGTVPLMLVLGALAQAFPKRGVGFATRVNVILVVALGIRMLLSGLRMVL